MFYFEQLKVGMEAHSYNIIKDEDILGFARISGDHNPVHISEAYGKTSRFKSRIAHGLISAGFISGLFGMKLPGPGCIWVSQELNFLAPVRIGDIVETKIKLLELVEKGNRAKFWCECKVQNTIVLNGMACIYIPRKPVEKD